MAIVLVRIDDRLVHGQVIHGWLPHIDVNTIAVATDAIDSPGWIPLMRIAVPSAIKFKAETVDGMAQIILNANHADAKTMLLVSNPQDVLRILDKGVQFESVNVGGMHHMNGKKQLLANVYVDDNDIETFKKIAAKGVKLEGRMLPADDKTDIMQALEKNKDK